jgi:hypothetical protein
LAVVRGPLAITVTALAALTAPASAAPVARERVHLAYDAPADCAARAVLEEAVAARAPAVQFTPPARSARVFAVVITRTDAGYQGSLAVDGAGGTGSRELAAARCDDLVEALALVIALAIDPAALSSPAPAPVAPPPPAAPSRWGGAAVIGAGTAGGVIPSPAPALAAEARLIRRGLGHAGLGLVAGSSERSTVDGDAAFRWLSGRGSLCWQWLDRRIESDACAHLDVGGITAEGSGVARAQQATRTWLAPGAHVAARWSPGWLLIEAQAGVAAPILRDHYRFAPGMTIHRTWAATPWVLIGTGVRFW